MSYEGRNTAFNRKDEKPLIDYSYLRGISFMALAIYYSSITFFLTIREIIRNPSYVLGNRKKNFLFT
jgi:hypothetical protein